MPERVPGLSSRSPGHQHHCITTEDLIVSHTDSPAMKSADNVRETEALPDVGILNSSLEIQIGSGVGRCESRDYGHPPSVSRLAPTPRHHFPVQPPTSSPDLPAYPGVCVPTRGCSITSQVISWIEEITTEEDGADHLTGDAAQVFAATVYEVRLHTPSLPRRTVSLVDIFRTPPYINQALNLPDLPPQLRRKWLRALCRVCGHRALLPRSLQIPLCYDRLQVPQYEGGCADVWMGSHQGRRVAAKVLRVYSTSDFGKIRRVGYLYTTLAGVLFN